MAGYIRDINPAPPMLTLAQNCEGWNTLPEAGGYLDQNYKNLCEMNVCLNYYRVISKTKNARGNAIHMLTHSERKLLKPLVDQGLL